MSARGRFRRHGAVATVPNTNPGKTQGNTMALTIQSSDATEVKGKENKSGITIAADPEIRAVETPPMVATRTAVGSADSSSLAHPDGASETEQRQEEVLQATTPPAADVEDFSPPVSVSTIDAPAASGPRTSFNFNQKVTGELTVNIDADTNKGAVLLTVDNLNAVLQWGAHFITSASGNGYDAINKATDTVTALIEMSTLLGRYTVLRRAVTKSEYKFLNTGFRGIIIRTAESRAEEEAPSSVAALASELYEESSIGEESPSWAEPAEAFMEWVAKYESLAKILRAELSIIDHNIYVYIPTVPSMLNNEDY